MAKRIDLEIRRGNTKKYKINLVNEDDSKIVLSDGDMLYFSVKENFEVDDPLIIKKLGEDIIYSEEDQCYHFTINSNDTEQLDYKSYVYDVKVVFNANREVTDNEKDRHTVIVGKFTVDKIVTFKVNE